MIAFLIILDGDLPIRLSLTFFSACYWLKKILLGFAVKHDNVGYIGSFRKL